jgi:glycyl-tRNA synthetase
MASKPAEDKKAAAAKGKTGAPKASKDGFDRTALEDLLKRRFFYAPAFSIYGGVRGLYDYGPPGAAVKNNLVSCWRQHFVLEENMLEIESVSVTPEIVLETSGHVEKFKDFMVKDKVTGDCHRADHLLEETIEKLLENEKLTPEERHALESVAAQADNYSLEELHAALTKYGAKAPDTGNEISEPFPFNLMFPTPIGPSGKEQGYLRPETAQGMFVNFKRLLEFNGGRLPFAAAQVGPAFRNEISPRAGLLRVREFTLAEIEHFVAPDEKDHPKFNGVKDTVLRLYPRSAQTGDLKTVMMTIGEAVEKKIVDNQTLGYFLVRCQEFLLRVGIKPNKLRFRQHLGNEMAHYACDCWDAEIETSYGWIECVGNADRSAYDLTVHSKRSGESLEAFVEFKDGARQIDTIELVLNKASVGKALKAAGKKVIDAVDKINDSLDFETATRIVNELESTGKAQVAGVEVSKDVLSFKRGTKRVIGKALTPSVIEPSFGIGRILYCIFEHAYHIRTNTTDQRAILAFKPLIAPIKVSLLPLMAKPELLEPIASISKLLVHRGLSVKVDDSGATIGRRYARMDEIGVPFNVTIDYDTLTKHTVTLRERDSMTQVLVPVDQLSVTLHDLVQEITSWSQVQAKFPSVEVKED